MIIFLLIALFICLYKTKVDKSKLYLNKDRTTSLKGIFILLVFFSHFNSYVQFTSPTDGIYHKVIAIIGQAMVTPFLFCSGYGVMESIKRKKEEYIRTMPVNRILATLFRFDIAVCIFALTSHLIGENITALQVITSLIAWNKVGNSNWYIFDMLVLYTLTWLVFLVLQKSKLTDTSKVWILTVFTVLFMIALRFTKGGIWWYDTILCYPLGMFWSIYKEKIDSFMERTWIWLLCFFGGIVITIALYFIPLGEISDILFNIGFICTLIILSMRIAVANGLLHWLGTHLFEIYILMRLPMILCVKFKFMQGNWLYLTFGVCLVLTLLMAKVYKLLTDFLWKKICSAIQNKKRRKEA